MPSFRMCQFVERMLCSHRSAPCDRRVVDAFCLDTGRAMRAISQALRDTLLTQLADVVRDGASDPDGAGLRALRLLRETDDPCFGLHCSANLCWSDLLDPSGLVQYAGGLALYGHPVPEGTRDVAGAVMPLDPEMPACARIVLERLHRVPPILLAEMAILRAAAEPSAAQLARARGIVAQVWSAG